MVAYADSVDYARRLLPSADWQACSTPDLEPDVRRLLKRLQPNAHWLRTDWNPNGFDRVVLVEVAPSSQFDVLRELGSVNLLPEGETLCLAGTGAAFHGHRQRGWVALAGNLHVSVALAPGMSVPHHGAAFMALPAVAAARAIEAAVPTLKAVRIKWVNDVVIDETKVAGVIAHTSAVGDRVDHVVLGVGLNVEATPEIERSPGVPRAGSLRDYHREVTQAAVFSRLLGQLAADYQALLECGPTALLAAYRRRSAVIGRHVEVCPDEPSAAGPVAGYVEAISDDLELVLHGRPAPISRGRLCFRPPAPSTVGPPRP